LLAVAVELQVAKEILVIVFIPQAVVQVVVAVELLAEIQITNLYIVLAEVAEHRYLVGPPALQM
jgi:hypothetical protein